MQISSLSLWANSRLEAEFTGNPRANTIKVLQGVDSLLVGRNVDTEQSRHG
jgi:hypothetical protein